MQQKSLHQFYATVLREVNFLGPFLQQEEEKMALLSAASKV
jgi:hypothetical protein